MTPAIAFPDRTRRSQIYQIALPIIGGMASQNILNLVDTAMVGSLGDTALAAAGVGSFANFMAISFILGLSAGVQAMASRRLGEGRDSETAVPLDGGLFLALVIGLPLSIILIQAAPALFSLLNDDPQVVALGGDYLAVRLIAMVGVGMNFSFRGYWSAVKMTGLYLQTIIIMHVVNIFLNWVLIFGNLGAPELGVYGAGLATTISIYFGTVMYFVLAWKNARPAGFLHGLPSKETMLTMLRVSLPSSMQQLFMATGMTVLFWIVGQIGTPQLAATHVLMTLSLVAILPAMGLGLAAASLIGHALGREDIADAKRWGWNVAIMAGVFGISIGIPAALLHDYILAVFLKDSETLAIATGPFLLIAVFIWFDAAGVVLFNAHLGAGDSRKAMLISILTQWLLFIPVAYLLGPVLGFGLMAIWISQIAYRAVQTVWLATSWWRGNWAGIKV